MRHISDGHEIRPRGGLLLVTTLHFYLHRYFPVAIDRSIREHSFLENLHMGNQGVSESQEPSNTQEVAAPPHPGMVVQQTGDCSSAVSYCAQLAHCASRVPACARSHRWWYSHPKHTGPCLLQREAHFRRASASIDASRKQSGCLLLRSVLAEAS